MKKRILIILLFFGLLPSCMSTEYIRTGDLYSPLPEGEKVTAFLSSKPNQKYARIGLLRIRGGDMSQRAEEAKVYARKNGGNGVIAREIGILTEPGTDTVIEEIETSTYETQEFIIIKLLAEAIAVKNEDKEEPVDFSSNAPVDNFAFETDPKASALDYRTLPRATYMQLIKEYTSLKGELFRGSLFPRKIYKVPNALKSHVENGERLVLVSTKSGKYRLYLLIQEDIINEFRKKIKSGKKMEFVYSPLDIYSTKRGDRPVLEFIEEIENDEAPAE